MSSPVAREILSLSLSDPLPVPVANGGAVANGLDHKIVNTLGSSPTGASPLKNPVAPYQALPITPQIITENITPALPVFDRSKMTQEVSLYVLGSLQPPSVLITVFQKTCAGG